MATFMQTVSFATWRFLLQRSSSHGGVQSSHVQGDAFLDNTLYEVHHVSLTLFNHLLNDVTFALQQPDHAAIALPYPIQNSALFCYILFRYSIKQYDTVDGRSCTT